MMSLADVAAVLGISDHTVWRLERNASDKIRNLLQKEGVFTESEFLNWEPQPCDLTTEEPATPEKRETLPPINDSSNWFPVSIVGVDISDFELPIHVYLNMLHETHGGPVSAPCYLSKDGSTNYLPAAHVHNYTLYEGTLYAYSMAGKKLFKQSKDAKAFALINCVYGSDDLGEYKLPFVAAIIVVV